MTTIAWDGRTLAADKLADAGIAWSITKIFRFDDGRLLGGAGGASHILAMVEWIRQGAKPEDFPPHQRDERDWVPIVVIEPGGRVLKYEFTPHPILHEGTFYACGSGRDFAATALHLGKTAREAVEIACLFDTGSGVGVDTLDL